ncbi:monovalent cation/H(+) antiporter subunit G [Spiribacter roseus]|uniref:monovalent cation/H(+) antiporter subunit G n=1 Tax=Spiribacter roseus TaxID=1855875 RepID=UPI001330F69D|nr:monovalent cation/H(+) antiporter subunit G [Spiribacter roseus]KAF0281218.1 sodium:proton antiporter [Spiribacter roseus]
MIEPLITLISAGMLLTGGAFAVIGGIGVVRFPDIYTRLHAGGVTDTIVPLLIVGGLVLQSGWHQLSFKLLLILLFLLFTTPTASHATARAAMAAGIEPVTRDRRRASGESSSNT